MLSTVYAEVIRRRDALASALRGPEYDVIVQKARDNWVGYVPRPHDASVAGIDSSFNSAKFQGVDLWVVTAVSVRSDGEVLGDRHRVGLGSDDGGDGGGGDDDGGDLYGMASRMEVEVCEATSERADLMLMDGSMHSQLILKKPRWNERVIRMVRRRGNVLFVAKTSSTQRQFRDLGSKAGDIFYYNHATRGPGFSKLFDEGVYGPGMCVASTFVRLSDSTPIIKVEFLGVDHAESEIKGVVDALYKDSVGGYPYALKLAHNNCKVSGRDIAKVSSMLGMGNEIGSREVLER